ncbi:MAG: NAD(P)-binding domain-containing protein [Nocardioidaceae bacterium]|nr:NAD(P)-binding domain-containing protein [Nocardioidaceae bacterium]
MSAVDATEVSRSVGFVGLGAMGIPMSGHLLEAGWSVVGHDTSASAVAQLVENGGRAAGGTRDVGEAVDHVVTSLPHASALLAVLRELGQAPRQGRPALVVVETSTLALEEKLAAREQAEADGLVLLDCTLSGTSQQARDRDVVAYLSGAEGDVVGHVHAILDDMVRATYDVGEFGAGTRLKLVANLLVAVHNLAAAEALHLAHRSGLDLALALPALADGAGGSKMLQVRGPVMVQGSFEQAAARVDIFIKDIAAIRALATDSRSPTPLLELSSVFYAAAVAQGRSTHDAACLYAVLEQLAAPGVV